MQINFKGEVRLNDLSANTLYIGNVPQLISSSGKEHEDSGSGKEACFQGCLVADQRD